MEEKKLKFPTETIDLPSKGLIYPKDNNLSSGKVEMKYMTAKEEDILTNQSYIEAGTVLDKLLQSLIVSDIVYNDLITGDKNALLIAARVLGYGSDYTFKYEDEEIEGGSEEDLQLELYNTKDALWAHYNATLNTYENTLTYNFASVVNFDTVTLGYKGTIEIENPNLSIKVYPNPTIDKVFIKYNYPINTILYNALGQLIAKGNRHEIDLSAYQSATYFLIIEDTSNQNTYSFKIFKD